VKDASKDGARSFWEEMSTNIASWFQGLDPKAYAVHNGLTDFGREVILEMNRLGMLIDVSHVSDKTMADAIAASKAPVFASHSSCRALSNIPRNVTDDQIRAIAKSGGVVMVNVSTLFLSQASVDAYLASRAAADVEVKEAETRYKDDPKTRDAEVARIKKKVHYPDADWKAVVDHMEHVMKVGGPQSVGIGTDYDGIEDPPTGLEDVSFSRATLRITAKPSTPSPPRLNRSCENGMRNSAHHPSLSRRDTTSQTASQLSSLFESLNQ